MLIVYRDAHNHPQFAVRHVIMYVHACEQASWLMLCRHMHKQSCNSAEYSAKAQGLVHVRVALQLLYLPFLIALCTME
jgi:hypothetical protein